MLPPAIAGSKRHEWRFQLESTMVNRMTDINKVTEVILARRAVVPEHRSLLVGLSGIDGVEGIFLFKQGLREYFDLRVWIDCSFSTALARALERRQEGLPPAATTAAYETIYFPAQRIHTELDNPRESADLIFDNDPYWPKQRRSECDKARQDTPFRNLDYFLARGGESYASR